MYWKVIINGEDDQYLEIIDRSDIEETHLVIGHYRKNGKDNWKDEAKIRIEGNYQKFLVQLTHKLFELTESKSS